MCPLFSDRWAPFSRTLGYVGHAQTQPNVCDLEESSVFLGWTLQAWRQEGAVSPHRALMDTRLAYNNCVPVPLS